MTLEYHNRLIINCQNRMLLIQLDYKAWLIANLIRGQLENTVADIIN